jgi:predicted transposase/invertase (TIGR01784 family)
MEKIEKEDDKEFEAQYPAQLYTKRPNPTALLSPLYDSTFKGIFTQETEDSNLALQCFVSAVLGRTVKNVILKPNEPAKDAPDQKGMSYDISIEFDNGEISDIEMQAWKEDYDYAIRAEIQSARLLNNNAKKGDNWDSPKVYQISILNFHYGKDDNKILSWYTMKNESALGLSDRQNIIFIDLKTIRKKLNTPVEELTPVEKWGLFFCYVDKDEYADYISELVRSEKGIMAAENTVRYMSEADDNWFVQNSRFIAERDKNTQIHNAEKRGREEGLQQGLQQGAQQKTLEAARSFYANGVSIEVIAKSLHMTEEEILKIVNKPVTVKA